MSKHLERLCQHYSQDFDLIFERETDPIDLFCQQHGLEDQRELLREMIAFYEGAVSGKSSLTDLVNMGLEYVPGDPESFAWLRSLIEYLGENVR
jgi:hypothetical protein